MQHRIIAFYVIAALLFLSSILMIEFSLKTQFADKSSFTDAVVKSRKGQLSCIIVGDSHAAAGFRDQIETCGNFGAGGLGILQVKDIVHSVQQKNDLQLVVITLGLQQFSTERLGNGARIFRYIAQDWEKGWNPLVIQPLLFDRWLQSIIQPITGALGIGKNAATSWDKIELSRKNRMLATRLEKQTPKVGMLESDAAVELFQLVDSLTLQNIQVCIVRTPVVPEYEALLQPMVESKEWRQLVAQLKHKEVNVVDYLDMQLTLQPADFSNEDHLNEKGAAKFAPLIIEKCSELPVKA